MKNLILSDGSITIVDEDIFEQVNKYKWRLFGNYVGRKYYSHSENGKSKYKLMYLHRLIMDTPKGMETDHINRNPLDNRRTNLRICTTSQNHANRPSKKGSVSKYKGVRHIPPSSRAKKEWIAELRINNKTVYLGNYKTEIEAALAYDDKAIEIFGEYALVNRVQTILKEVNL